MNLRAFRWGRIVAHKPELIEQILTHAEERPPETLEALIAERAARLVDYQNAAYAARYRAFVIDEVAAAEAAKFGAPGRLTRAVAEGLFRVMAYKDEYEVARMHVAQAATYGERPVFHLAPAFVSVLTGGAPKDGGPRKKVAVPGRVALPLFRMLQHGKRLRGTRLDPFARQSERKWERALIGEYMADIRMVLQALRPETVETAIAIAELPDMIRGFGPVKEANRAKAMERRKTLLAKLNAPEAAPVAVAAE